MAGNGSQPPAAEHVTHGDRPRSPVASRRRTLLVGWDAADWRLLHPLIDSGRLPTIASLIERGAMGDLASVFPTTAPLTWTTVATGLRADRHGILIDRELDPVSGDWQPVSCRGRTAKAIWNIATQNGVRSAVVNWAAGHPAEPILGTCVDERITSVTGPPGPSWPMQEGCVHPAHRAATLAELRLHPAEVPAEAMRPFVPRLADIDVARDQRPRLVAAGLAATVSVHAVATEIVEHDDWEFAAIRYHLLEPLGHAFMRYREPLPEGVTREDADLYGGVVDAGCMLLDAMLARLLELAGPDTTLVLVSDHGFQSSSGGPTPADDRAGPSAGHSPRGIVVIAGPDVRADHLVHGATLLDIAPTVLGLLGVPAASDMPGRILAEAFHGPPMGGWPGRIASWEAVGGECGRHPPCAPDDLGQTSRVIRELVALGYADTSPAEAAMHAAVDVRRELHRAMAQLQARDDEAAIATLRHVVAAAPADLQARLILATSLLAKGDVAECRRLATESAADPRLAALAELLLGMVAASEGRKEESLAHLVAAERGGAESAFVLSQAGWAHIAAGRHTEAERLFRAVRTLDRDNVMAALGLAIVHSACGRPAESADEALTAIGLRYFLPEAHAQLGIALVGMRRIGEAVQAFETSVTQRPSVIAHEWLASIHEQSPCDAGKAAAHREAARALRRGTARPAPSEARA